MTRNLLRILLSTLLAIWLGAMLMLLNGVMALFAAHPRAGGSSVAVQGAPVLFNAFERVGVWVAIATMVVAALTAAVWKHQRWVRKTIIVMVAMALACFMVSFLWLTPEIDRLREAGQNQTDEFRSKHNYSNVLYLGQLSMVVVAFVASLVLKEKPKEG
jgi:hypothetical protein